MLSDGHALGRVAKQKQQPNRPNMSEKCPKMVSGLQKGPAERGHVKKRQKVSKSLSTLFDNFRAGQKKSKIVKKCQKVFRHFSTIFARHPFSGPFCNPLKWCSRAFCIRHSSDIFQPLVCEPPGLLQEAFGPFGPEVPPRVSPKTGARVSKAVSRGVSPEPFGPRLGSVQKASQECPRSVVKEREQRIQGETEENEKERKREK